MSVADDTVKVKLVSAYVCLYCAKLMCATVRYTSNIVILALVYMHGSYIGEKLGLSLPSFKGVTNDTE